MLVLVATTTVLTACQQQPPPRLGTCRTNHGLKTNSLTCSLTPQQVTNLSGIAVPQNAVGFESVYRSYSPTVNARYSIPLSDAPTVTSLKNFPSLVVDGPIVTSTDTRGGLTRSVSVESRPTELSVYIVISDTKGVAAVNQTFNNQPVSGTTTSSAAQVGKCNTQDFRSTPCSPTQQEVSAESGVPIPSTATQFTSTYEGFTDWRIGASFRVPLSDSSVYLLLPNFPGVAIDGPEVSGVNDGASGQFRTLQLRSVGNEVEVLVSIFTT